MSVNTKHFYEGDLTGRFEKFGKTLCKAISNSDDSFTLAIDAPWGAGKTTFVNMWSEHLESLKEFIPIIFNAFEHDMEEDSFIPLVSKLVPIIESDGIKKQPLRDRISKVFKHLWWDGGRNLISAVSGGVISQELINDANIKFEEKIAHMINAQIDSCVDRQQDFKAFKELLQSSIPDGNKIVFIIDELDRCSPRTAINVLERVAQLFDVKNIFFIFSLNRQQLIEAIKGFYGQSFAAEEYLHKFIHFRTSLISHNNANRTIKANYFNSLFMPSTMSEEYLTPIGKILDSYDCTFRDIEQIATLVKLCYTPEFIIGPAFAVYVAAVVLKCSKEQIQNISGGKFEHFCHFSNIKKDWIGAVRAQAGAIFKDIENGIVYL